MLRSGSRADSIAHAWTKVAGGDAFHEPGSIRTRHTVGGGLGCRPGVGGPSDGGQSDLHAILRVVPRSPRLGAGNGPLAATLTTPPANLCLLSQRFGNPLPQDIMELFIDGRADGKAHGPRDMPVWGERFYAESNGDAAEIKQRIAKRIAFLQSIQTATRSALLKLEEAAFAQGTE